MFTVNSNFTLINLGYLAFLITQTKVLFHLDKPENLLGIQTPVKSGDLCFSDYHVKMIVSGTCPHGGSEGSHMQIKNVATN